MASQKKDTQGDECGHLREEFRRLIVPLLRKSLEDKPSDTTVYCARYFQCLLNERKKGGLSENREMDGQKDELLEGGGKVMIHEPKPQLQGSMSLPLLTEDGHSSGLSLRETSSWSNPSDSSSLQPRLWDMSYDVADAMSHIGDQSDQKTTGEDAEYDICTLKTDGPNTQLSFGDKLIGEKESDFDVNDSSVTSEGVLKERMKPHLGTDTNLRSPPPLVDEIEQELNAIVDLASKSTCTPPQSTNRRKWSDAVNLDKQFEIKPPSPEVLQYSGEDDDPEDSFSKFQDEKDEMAAQRDVCGGSTSPKASFGFIPHLKDSGAKEQNMEDKSTSLSKEDVENLVKSLSRTLQELLRGLLASELFFNKKLQKVKKLGCIEHKSNVQERMKTFPRKKRSATTFSISDDLSKCTKFLKAPKNIPDVNNGKDTDIKISRKLFECKSSDSKVDEALARTTGNIVNSGSPSETDPLMDPKNAPIAETTHSHLHDNIISDEALSLNQIITKAYGKNAEKVANGESISSHSYHKVGVKEGIVNKGFVMEDAKKDREPRKTNQISHYGQNKNRQNSNYDSRYRSRQSKCSDNFPFIRIPYSSSARNFSTNRPHNRTYPHTPRIRPESGFSYIGEGGDAVSPIQRQCSVATETDAAPETERSGIFDERIRSVRIHPPSESDAIISNSVDSNSENCDTVDKLSLYNISSVSDHPPEVDDADYKLKSCTQAEGESAPFLENNPQHLDQDEAARKQELQNGKTDLKPAKKSSSLNPCAECFNPGLKHLAQSKGSQSKPATAEERAAPNEREHMERDSSGFTNPNLEQSANHFSDINVEWEYELLENDVFLQEHDPVQLQSLLSVNSEIGNGVISLSLSEIEEQEIIEREIRAARQASTGQSYPNQENGNRGRVNEFDISSVLDSDTEVPNTKGIKKCNCKLDMAEGDRSTGSEQEHSGNQESAEKRDESSIGSACGDFAVSDNINNEIENDEENPRNGLESIQVPNVPAMISLEDGILNIPSVNAENNVTSSIREDEEIELNFACFSGSDSSEVDSSDVSDEELSGENEVSDNQEYA